MLETLDWSLLIWTALVFISGYFVGSRKRNVIQEPLNFDTSKITPIARARIEDSLQAGQKIDAIRTLRADTGLGLKDAKSVIDNWHNLGADKES
jgi:hypothetical protein